MAQGILEEGNPDVEFYCFFRQNICSNGYSILCGIDEFISDLAYFRFSDEDIEYLSSLKIFKKSFLSYLKNFEFRGSLDSFDEGSIIFPYEPVIRVSGNFVECTLIESMILNYINYATSVATKASRIVSLAAGRSVMEFGMRRSPFLNAANSESRAAFIGGCSSTSNTLAGKLYDIPVAGTMAHAWVMSFESQLKAFYKFAELYPENCILLIDTYDTLKSGIEDAIKVGLDMKKKGIDIGVRIDSGDLMYLSKKVREKLDIAGLKNATICLSNDIDESIIASLLLDNTPVDSFGIGTKLVSPHPTGFVYKLTRVKNNNVWKDTMKISSSIEKSTLPGRNQVYRMFDSNDQMMADIIEREESFRKSDSYTLYHMIKNEKFVLNKEAYFQKMLNEKMINGKVVYNIRSAKEIRNSSLLSLSSLHSSYKRILNPHVYKVSLGENLKNLRNKILSENHL